MVNIRIIICDDSIFVFEFVGSFVFLVFVIVSWDFIE